MSDTVGGGDAPDDGSRTLRMQSRSYGKSAIGVGLYVRHHARRGRGGQIRGQDRFEHPEERNHGSRHEHRRYETNNEPASAAFPVNKFDG